MSAIQMFIIITTDKKLIDNLDIKSVEDSYGLNGHFIFVNHFHSERTEIKIPENTTDLNKFVINTLITNERKKKLNVINDKIKKKRSIFKKLFNIN